MSHLSINAFHSTVQSGGEIRLEPPNKDRPEEMELVRATRSLGGKVLDWVARGLIGRQTDWGKSRVEELRSQRKRAFDVFVGALKETYGSGKNEEAVTTHRSNIGKAIREAFNGRVPKLDARNLAKMESIAKTFKGQGEAKNLKRNLVIRCWPNEGLTRTGHAAAGIRNRITHPQEKEKYVSLWPGKGAGGLREIGRGLFNIDQEGTLGESRRHDNRAELADRTKGRLEKGWIARSKLTLFSENTQKFLLALDEIGEKHQSGKEATPDLKKAVDTLMREFNDASTEEGTIKLALLENIRRLGSDVPEPRISLTECIGRLKQQCKNHVAHLEDQSKFQPRARQKRYVETVYDKGARKEVTVVSWGLKPEKFYLPLAGQNKTQEGRSKFSFFGLKETPMVEQHDSLSKRSRLANARSAVLYWSDKDLTKEWNSRLTPMRLVELAKDLQATLPQNSASVQKLGELIDKADIRDQKAALRFLHDLQRMAKEVDHQTPYRMLSQSQNCAGTIMDLMELGGAEAFASKPTVGPVTSPNDTAAWAKRVLVEVDRLNHLAQGIMEDEQPGDMRSYSTHSHLYPTEVLKPYKSLLGLASLEVIPHEELMKEMKALVEAISNAKDFDKSLGAGLIKEMLPLYEKAGHPVPE